MAIFPLDSNQNGWFTAPMKITKKAMLSFVRGQLATNAVWTVRALVKIYSVNQMPDEKSAGATFHDNGIGFSGKDSQFLSSLAQGAIKYGNLTEKQLAVAFRLIPRYARQVIELSDSAKLETAYLKANPQG